MHVDTGSETVSLEGSADVDAVFEEFDEDSPEEVMALRELIDERDDVDLDLDLEDLQPELPTVSESWDGEETVLETVDPDALFEG